MFVPAPALLQVVNTEMDLPDATLGDGIPLAANGFVSLRSVIEEVNASGNGNAPYTVEFANVLGQQFQDITGGIVLPGAQTEMTIHLSSQLPALDANREYHILGSTSRRVATIRNPNVGISRFRFIEVSPNAKLQVNGLKFSGADNRNGTGGAIYNHPNGTLDVVNCYFASNIAQAGGAIGNSGALTVATGTRTEFMHNTATQGGGAIYIGGNNPGEASADLTNVLFVDNVAGTLPEDGRRATNKGGAIATNATALVRIDGCEFRENRAKEGGAIYADGAWTGVPSVIVNSSQFWNNHAGEPGNPSPIGGLGGAAYVNNLNVKFVGCEFRQNKSDEDGGAIFQSRGRLTLDTCTFFGNVADGPKQSHDVAEMPPPGVLTVVFLINTTAIVVKV